MMIIRKRFIKVIWRQEVGWFPFDYTCHLLVPCLFIKVRKLGVNLGMLSAHLVIEISPMKQRYKLLDQVRPYTVTTVKIVCSELLSDFHCTL